MPPCLLMEIQSGSDNSRQAEHFPWMAKLELHWLGAQNPFLAGLGSFGFMGGLTCSKRIAHLPKANRPEMTFWFPLFGPCLTMAPKGEPFFFKILCN